MTDERGNAATFLQAMIARGVLSFGEFTLKSGRRSPYFFNLGAVADGPGLELMGRAYAAEAVRLRPRPQVLFGPAYKGIPIATAAAIALAQQHGIDAGIAFDRKEAKAHGEGGRLVGSVLAERKVAIVDDVVTDGTAKREAFETIEAAGGEVVGVVLALDRQEKLANGATAVQTLQREFDVPVRCVATFDDLLGHLADKPQFAEQHDALLRYREQQP